MPRRTVTVTHLWMTTRYRTDEHWDLTALPKDGDLLYQARALFEALPKDYLVDRDNERYVSIEEQRMAGRTLLVELQAGPLGASGEIRNINTHETEHEYDVTGAATSNLRAMLVVPVRSRSALFFIEHGGTNAGGGALLRELKLFLRQRYRELTVRSEIVVEPAAWLEEANLMKATAVVYGYSPDLEDQIEGLPKILGRVEHTILPERGSKILPRAIYDGLVDKQLNRSQLFGIREEEEIGDVSVKMTNHGREKTFSLGSERFPALRYQLSDAGSAEPTAEEFHDFCLTLAPDIFSGVGADWQHADASDPWPAEAFDVAVEVPPR